MPHPLTTVLTMPMHLTVGPGLAALVDPLVEVLAAVPHDPFAAQTVAVPGEGVRSWLTWQLSQRLEGGHGIVANVDWVFPSAIVNRSLGLADQPDPWHVDALTWAVHHVLTTRTVDDVAHVRPDLSHARTIADLFDRYGTRRPGMVAAWERGHDVDALGRSLAEAHRWQPRLWRALNEHLGSPSSAVQNFDRLSHLRRHGPPQDLPRHLVLVGITSLPPFSLEVLSALSRHREVVMLSPVPSPDLWQRLGEVVERLQRTEGFLDLPRGEDPSVFAAQHPLMVSWGRSSREAQVQLAGMSLAHGVIANVIGPSPDPQVTGDSLLAALRADVVADRPPVPVSHDLARDRSVRWHRCHGAPRQAEVLRDALLHLFELRDEQGPRYHPRDVGVVCTDVATFGPLIEAAFAGVPDQGVPAIPVRVADRTLGGEAPLVDVVCALVGLLDRRWRRDDVVAFARLGAVRQRFGFTTEQLALVADWFDATHVRWGLRASDHHRAGLPGELRAHSLLGGLEQLVVGAALAPDASVGPAGVVATGDLEGDDLEVLGALADLLDRLADAVDDLAKPAPVKGWVRRLQTAVADLADLPDADAWQWGVLANELTSLAEAAHWAGSDVAIDAAQLGELVVARLTSRSGRPRFDTGAVTVSSVAGQRGIPRRVICVVGLDEVLLTTGVPASDDLVAAQPMVGDPDPRADLRALLFDAVLAAQEQLMLFSTGFDVRSNDEVAPAVALAELVEAIDREAGGVEARQHWVVDHPRQSWSLRSFLPDALGEPGPFSFHRGALAMFERSRRGRHRPTVLEGVLPPQRGDVELTHITSALDHAVQALLRDRCGLWLPDTSERASQVMPLNVAGLAAWALRDDALRAVLRSPGGHNAASVIAERLDLARRRGALPPLALGDPVAHDLQVEVEALIAEAQRLGAVLGSPGTAVDVSLDLPTVHPHRVRGRIECHGPHQLVHLTSSSFQPGHVLRAWIDLAAMTLARPGDPWEAIVVSRGAKGRVLRLVSADAALEVLSVATQFMHRARQSVLPLTAAVSEALYRRGELAARTLWTDDYGPANDRWMQWAVGDTEFDELLTLEPWPDEQGPSWGDSPSRLRRWSQRLWATFDATVAGS